MLIVAGWFEVDPDDREAFLAQSAESMHRTRDEPGCHDYVFSADPLTPGRVVLYELWEDGESLAAHIAGIRSRPAPTTPRVTVIRSELKRYEISSVGPLGG